MKNSKTKWFGRLIIGLLISTTAMGQTNSNVSKPITVKGVEEIAQERQPELFLPRSEFETSKEYEQRMTRAKQAVEAVRASFLAEENTRQAERERLASERAAEAQRQAQIKIATSRASVTFTPSSLGTYDADREIFPLTVNRNTYQVTISR
nr:hypothetical protein [Chlorobium phaeobacteroides]